MQFQPWVANPEWHLTDPKFLEMKNQKARLTHTLELVNAISILPAGILVIRGPRQVGKSTFLREFAMKCLAEKIPPESIALYDAERFKNRYSFESEIEHFINGRDGYTVILIDELPAIDKWWLSVKGLADRGALANSLLVCTGSSSADLAADMDFMPGRRGKRHPVDFELLPVQYKAVRGLLSVQEYALTGGFPWCINEYLKLGIIPAYVYQLYAAWIQGAFHKKRHATHLLPFVLEGIANHTGTPMSVQKFSRDCGLGSNSTAEQYLTLLVEIYSVISCYWAEPSAPVPSPRKNRKFFPADPFLYHLFTDFGKGWDTAFDASKARCADPGIMGGLAETIVAAELRRNAGYSSLRYWLGNKEIDFIAPELVEVKYQEHVSAYEFAWAEKVLPGNSKLTVVTKNDRSNTGRIELVPMEEWLCNR